MSTERRLQVGGAKHRDAATENFGNHDGRIAGTVDAKIGELVGRQTLCMKRAEAGFIAKQGTTGHGHAAREQDVDGSVQPDDWNASVAEKFGSAGLGVGASTEGENGGFVKLDGAAEGGAQLVGFQLPESGLTVAFEEFAES